MSCKHPSWKVRIYRDYDRGKGFYYIGCKCRQVLLSAEQWQAPSYKMVNARKAKDKREQTNTDNRQWACPWHCGGLIAVSDKMCPTCTGVLE